MTDTHRCPGGCGEQVAPAKLACRRDWFRLPKVYRDEIRSTYRRGTDDAHRVAVMQALAWYDEHPIAATP